MAATAQDRLAQLLADSREALLRYVRRLTRSPDVAEDIAQEAISQTLERGDEVREPQKFVFMRARTLTWRWWQARRGDARDPDGDAALLELPDPAPSPEDAAIAQAAYEALQAAVERLPPQCRKAFGLRMFYGHSYREIAEELGISVKTVEKHVTRGLRDTRIVMERHYRAPGTRSGGARD